MCVCVCVCEPHIMHLLHTVQCTVCMYVHCKYVLYIQCLYKMA